MFPVGRPRAFEKTTVAGVGEYTIRPPEGYEWLILGASFYHDDTVSGNLAAFWKFTDTEKNVSSMMGYTSALAAWEVFNIYSWEGTQVNDYGHLIKITRSFYPYCYADSINAAKHIVVKCIYIERPLNYELLFEEIIAYRLGFKLPLSSKEY